MRINDSLLIRIIGLNLLEYIPIFYADFLFFKNDGNEDENHFKERFDFDGDLLDDALCKNDEETLKTFDDKYPLSKPHTANRENIKMTYIEKLLCFYLFNFMSIEIKIAEYWHFNINFTQPIIISLNELQFL